MIRLLLVSIGLFAHGDLHEQIERVTKAIAVTPSNAALYLQRGELHRLHREWPQAFADYSQAERLDASLAGVDLGRARFHADQKQWPEAETAITRYIGRVPANEIALALRAEIRDNANKPSAADWSAAIASSLEPRVDYYIALATAHERQAAHRESLAAIDAGLERLGPLVTLRQWAVESLARQRRWDEALARVDTLIADSPRKESWITRKAELQYEANRRASAVESAQAARGAIAQLSQRVRETKAMADLQVRLDKITSGTARR